ncbi:MAG: hypothetical protein ABI539_06555 [Acidobacteriota bacterium]
MLISLILITFLTLGGAALTHLIARDGPLLWRLSAGCIIGSTICGTAAFILACAFGLNAGTAAAAVIVSMLPLAVFLRPDNKNRLTRDWQRARGKLDGANSRKFARFAYYLFFFLLFLAFFSRAMIETPDGIFTGASQNLGDLPFHLGAIFSFTDGANFPPQNPSFAGAKFSYPFAADLLTAVFAKFGAGVSDAMFILNVAWAFSLLVIIERFVLNLTGDRLAARLGPVMLFFSGGLGFTAFFTDFWAQSQGLFEFIRHIPLDYTIGERFRWGNSMVVMFITQRSILLGMPLSIFTLNILWELVSSQKADESEKRKMLSPAMLPFFILGLLAGLLPLIHLHSLFVLFVTGVALLILWPGRRNELFSFAIGVALSALPELVWSVSGSASETTRFFGWHFGWDKGEQNFLWFWLTNTGLFIPMALLGLWLVFSRHRAGTAANPDARSTTKAKAHHLSEPAVDSLSLLWFYTPFAFLFVLANTVKLAPWEWDNIKVLIYWFVGTIPFAAIAISWLWRQKKWGVAAAVLGILILTLSGAIDVWRTASGQVMIKVFDKDAVEIARQLREKTPATGLFLNAPTYNTAGVLTGRPSLMRYTGHLSSHGIDYSARESDVKRIYRGGAAADQLMEKYGIEYVLISPEEKNTLSPNEMYFSKFPVTAESGAYRVYKVR